ncbi:acyl-CoA/acyl-ACP dehydrogenase [Flavobacteriaceae bacterium]|jgi:acyl-CoA dehydrogenase|nr:acyl-CoA/acyl-ACP dehydrogenase [bacterium]MDB4093407.1 acyl-CoA/acyl-ACP dehydrogenase [Flavobacteriaceae bacterium]MDB9852926.1 acyl-CoA/acyl-ACP dehydrogenase [Flavobacteriaceae bacterium]MDB9995092.1 acyl-CoA/acyl-ACP dehydrogenase [Flavobacteriaceae bacterium]|tara:strand:+ start:11397 stop:12521 length:1125 start_codon:yes stop_codon:yes gene_type:complete
MALVINEEQQMLKSSTKEFLDLKSPLSLVREMRDNNYNQFSSELWTEMVEMGWTALTIPEKYNGLNFGYVGLGQVLEEMGRKLTVSPIISTVLTSTSLISLSKNEVLKNMLFQEIMNGNKLCTLAHEEGSHHSPNIEISIVSKKDDVLVLNGKKRFVIDGSISDYLIVSANHESEKNVDLILVDSKSEGISFNNKVHMDSRIYSDISFDNVKIEKDNFLSSNGDGFEILEKTLDIARIGLAAEMLGNVQQAFEMTMQYLKEREQFGVKIGSFQSLQHRSALMFGEIELCKSIVLKALQAIDSDDEKLPELASLAKAKLGQVSKLVTNEAVQMHGGIGVTDDADIGFFLKRTRVTQRTFGDSNFHLDRVAKINKY